MKTLHFSTLIHASAETVWRMMLGPDSYRQWTAPFAEGSHFDGSWEQGQQIRFLGPDGNGMVARIAENRPHEFISIQHLGCIINGVEDRDSEQARNWVQCFENYRFINRGADTELQVEMETGPDYEQYMTDTWPRALAVLKALCETPKA